MAESTVVKVKRDAQILLADLGAVHTYTVAFEPGDYKYTVPDYQVNNFLDRGVIGTTPSLRIGNDQPMTASFSAYLRDLGDTSGSPAYATLADIAHRYLSHYVATVWVSTMSTNSDAFTITVAFTIDGSVFGEADKTVTFPFSVFRANVSEGDPDMVDCSLTSWCIRPILS